MDNVEAKLREMLGRIEELLSLASEGLLKAKRYGDEKEKVERELVDLSKSLDERDQLKIEKIVPKWHQVYKSDVFLPPNDVNGISPLRGLLFELLAKYHSPHSVPAPKNEPPSGVFIAARKIENDGHISGPRVDVITEHYSGKGSVLANPHRDYSNLARETDEELLAIIRRAENTNVPGSLYQRANNEWQIRHQQKLIEATRAGRGGISFEVGGDMINDGTIQTDTEAKVDIAVAGNYTSKKGKIIQGQSSPKEWYERPLGVLILTIVAGVVVGGILYWLHWV